MNKTLFIITIILIVIATVVTISFFNIKKKFDFIIDSYKIAFENDIPFLYILLSVNNRSFLSAKIKNVTCKLYNEKGHQWAIVETPKIDVKPYKKTQNWLKFKNINIQNLELDTLYSFKDWYVIGNFDLLGQKITTPKILLK